MITSTRSAGHADAVRALLRHSPPPKHIPDFIEQVTPIKAAARGGHRHIVKLLAAAQAQGFGGGGGGQRQQQAGQKQRRQQQDSLSERHIKKQKRQ